MPHRFLPLAVPRSAGGWRARLALLAAPDPLPPVDPVTEATLITHRAVVDRLPVADGLAAIRRRTAARRRWWPW
ncbi:hypothetical protein FHS43_000540 [Streptosporangium becharense]|uniref:Uncharacterized protein n=1 Tax=Streptosporangium becharense TaxID=1816182 RepID=A0A7W9IN68_9ACTN|nr:hypothetical protein [Streptosporangium becharense]MBB2909294.1 hypothetical protein [Streptosporangium becharense]MBB5823803.1 hypothetical protein [Streptosporangium becharense]